MTHSGAVNWALMTQSGAFFILVAFLAKSGAGYRQILPHSGLGNCTVMFKSGALSYDHLYDKFRTRKSTNCDEKRHRNLCPFAYFSLKLSWKLKSFIIIVGMGTCSNILNLMMSNNHIYCITFLYIWKLFNWFLLKMDSNEISFLLGWAVIISKGRSSINHFSITMCGCSMFNNLNKFPKCITIHQFLSSLFLSFVLLKT